MAKPEDDLRPERILELSERLSAVAGRRIGEISAVKGAFGHKGYPF